MLETDIQQPGPLPSPLPTRCVIVVDQNLSPGYAANAAAVIALTIGQRHPALVGAPLIDATGFAHPGLVPIAIPVLAAPPDDLPGIRRRGLEAGCDVVDFPREGQQATNYDAFRAAVAALQPDAMQFVGVALIGPKKAINKIVGNLALLK